VLAGCRWRALGSKGALTARFAAVRVRSPTGPTARAMATCAARRSGCSVNGAAAATAILPEQSATGHCAAPARRRHQSALGLRAGASATQAGARCVRGTIVDRPASTCIDGLHRLRLLQHLRLRAATRGNKTLPTSAPLKPRLPEICRALIARLFAPPKPPSRCPHCRKRLRFHSGKVPRWCYVSTKY
jgi:hypothetical protein